MQRFASAVRPRIRDLFMQKFGSVARPRIKELLSEKATLVKPREAPAVHAMAWPAARTRSKLEVPLSFTPGGSFGRAAPTSVPAFLDEEVVRSIKQHRSKVTEQQAKRQAASPLTAGGRVHKGIFEVLGQMKLSNDDDIQRLHKLPDEKYTVTRHA